MNESTKGFKQRKLPVFLRVMLFWGCYMAILILEWKVKTKIPPQWGQLFWGLASSAALLLLTFVFLLWEGRTFRDVGLNLEAMSVPRLVTGIAIGLASFAAILLLINIVAGPMRLTRGTASSGSMVIAGCSILALACMEELGFRGYPLRTLVRTLGMWQAQAIALRTPSKRWGMHIPAQSQEHVRLSDVLLQLHPSLPTLRSSLRRLVRMVHRYYGAVRLLQYVHVRRTALGLHGPAFA